MAPLVAEGDAEVLQVDVDKLQVRPITLRVLTTRERLCVVLLQVTSRKCEQPMAKPTEAALNVDVQQPRGAPAETGSLDPPSDMLKIRGNAVEPAVSLDLTLVVQRCVRGFLARRRVKQEVRRDCAPPDGKIAAVRLAATMGASPYQVSNCCPVPPAASRAVSKSRSFGGARAELQDC